jgi:hypothetical protein
MFCLPSATRFSESKKKVIREIVEFWFPFGGARDVGSAPDMADSSEQPIALDGSQVVTEHHVVDLPYRSAQLIQVASEAIETMCRIPRLR